VFDGHGIVGVGAAGPDTKVIHSDKHYATREVMLGLAVTLMPWEVHVEIAT
jgi:hypothetical protein